MKYFSVTMSIHLNNFLVFSSYYFSCCNIKHSIFKSVCLECNDFLVLVPSAPENVEMKNITSESVLVSWSSPQQPNGIILGYRYSFVYPCILISLYPCILVSLYPCILVSLYPCILVSLYLCILVSLYPCILISFNPCVLASLNPCIMHPCILISFHPCILVTWFPCRLYYMHTNYTDVQTIRESTERSSFNLTGLGNYNSL